MNIDEKQNMKFINENKMRMSRPSQMLSSRVTCLYFDGGDDAALATADTAAHYYVANLESVRKPDVLIYGEGPA